MGEREIGDEIKRESGGENYREQSEKLHEESSGIEEKNVIRETRKKAKSFSQILAIRERQLKETNRERETLCIQKFYPALI